MKTIRIKEVHRMVMITSSNVASRRKTTLQAIWQRGSDMQTYCSKESKTMSNSDENHKFFYICFVLTFKNYVNQCKLCWMANRSVEEFKNKKFIKLNFRFDFSKGFLKLNKSCIKSNQFCKWLGSKKNLVKKFWW
jgi:hypothetical protein